MKLSYANLLSPYPLKLNIGSVKKPKLKDIAEMSFERFNEYQVLLRFQSALNTASEDNGQKTADAFEIIVQTKSFQEEYVEMFNFFFEERVVFHDSFFILLDKKFKEAEIHDLESEFDVQDIKGIISEKNFGDLTEVIAQICGMEYEGEEEAPKFKNKLAEKLYKKMEKARKKNAVFNKENKNFSIPNIISAVASKHPSLNFANIWDITIYQLIDTFQRLQMNAAYEINARSVSIWGDKKKKFDDSIWFKNRFD